MTDNLPTVAADPSYGVDSYRVSTNAAHLCGDIVRATATKIQGKKYVCVEGWHAIAAAHGCLVSIATVEAVEGGIRAVAELRRMSDGLVLATAEGFVGEDERMWAGRPLYARRAMAQTRASSRVCRSAFAHVVVLIDRDLGTTPAEEMMGVTETIQHAPPAQPEHAWTTEARNDGLMQNAPEIKPEVLERARARVNNAIEAFRMAGHTKETLMAFWADNKKTFDAIYKHVPAEHERLVAAYDEALNAAPKAAA